MIAMDIVWEGLCCPESPSKFQRNFHLRGPFAVARSIQECDDTFVIRCCVNEKLHEIGDLGAAEVIVFYSDVLLLSLIPRPLQLIRQVGDRIRAMHERNSQWMPQSGSKFFSPIDALSKSASERLHLNPVRKQV